jgi:hypothetical protein
VSPLTVSEEEAQAHQRVVAVIVVVLKDRAD